jgi:putative sterol carrier protein
MSMLVECRSEHEYAERPVALTWEGQRLEISQIVARWRSPGEKRFRVRTADGRLFDLTYYEAADEWQINPK